MTAVPATIAPRFHRKWRVLDLVVVSVIGSTFGVVYWAWNQIWLVTAPLFIAFPPAQAVLYGTWMLPQVLAGFLVRRPGAALFGAMMAVIVSSFLGNVFGLTVLIYGLVQGLAAEAVFAMTRYRAWNWATAGLATGLAAAAGTSLDVTLYYPFWEASWKVTYILVGAGSGFLLGALFVPFIVSRLAAAGALAGLPASRADDLLAKHPAGPL